MLLDDLLAAMRTFPDQRRGQHLGRMSINPTAEGIRNLREFQKQIPSRISDSMRDQITPEIAKGLRDSLGMTNVEIMASHGPATSRG